MTEKDFANVQRLVLHGSLWERGRHLSLEFLRDVSPRAPLRSSARSHALAFLTAKRAGGTPLCRPTGAWPAARPTVQLSFGISRRGLAALHVPAHVLACFALKSPAFTAGAALRSSRHLGTSGHNAPPYWDDAFHHTKLDAVLSLHGQSDHTLDSLVDEITSAAHRHDVVVRPLPATRRLANRPGMTRPLEEVDRAEGSHQREQWAHFGFRDGLARVGISGWTREDQLAECRPSSIHEMGEFVLGYPQDSRANPYIAGPGSRVWPGELRAFFRDGSFGVLHQMWQDVGAFEAFVHETAKTLEIEPDLLKAKLCGRYPDGRVLSAAPAVGRVDADFDFANDVDGWHCPFGSHIRRMNPRGQAGSEGALAHAARSRALLRRGMPYVLAADKAARKPRGFVGHFFCASIEDQFEHLVGQWGERVPLGSADRGNARDPLIGAHTSDDSYFDIPSNDPSSTLKVTGLAPFAGVVGTSYLFYPSLSTFDGIVASQAWLPDEDEAEA